MFAKLQTNSYLCTNFAANEERNSKTIFMYIKKRIGIIIILMLFSAGFLQAKPVDVEKAKKVALNHLQKESRFVKTPNAIRLQSARATAQALRSDSPNVSYYVFNINDNQGFIIVSGDDIALPVLAYSDKGKYDESQLPPNFVYWMNGLEAEIIAAQNQSLQADAETRIQWDNYLSGNVLRSGIWPSFLVQTQWNQYEPYNLLCPKIGAVRTVTGCVATAMAQIMKFHNYPEQANSMEAYTTSGTSIYIPAIESPENYDWNNMSLIYNGLNASTENDAVAALMYHCGVASYMDYNIAANGGSGATINDAGRAFRDIFDYDANIQLKMRNNYTSGAWKSFLLNEIVDEQRPVFYAGQDMYNAGHAFVCDGYQPEGDYFHFNWGWGGYYDGWFLLNALNPGTGGAGAGSGVYSYNQQILTHIQPNTGESATLFELKLYQNLVSAKTTAVRNDTWTLSAVWVGNFGLFGFSGSIGAFLVDGNDQIVDMLGFINYPINSFTAVGLPITCVIHPSTKAGNYRLQIFSKASGASEWTRINGMDASIVDFVNITITSNDPLTARWTPKNTTTTDWNDGGNWSPKMPGIDSDVTIGAAATYPILTGTSYVNDIYFEAGAELGNQHLLSYNKAIVNYNLASKRWHLISTPIAASVEDFYRDKEPSTWMQGFGTAYGSDEQWNYITALDHSFAIGDGFAFYCEDNFPLATPFSLKGQLAGITLTKTLNWGNDGNADFALVGNPFMATIDFDALSANNSSIINDSYLVYTDDGYSGYNVSVGAYGVDAPHSTTSDKFIAPLQGFIVEGGATGSLAFHANMQATGKSAGLRNSQNIANKLSITADNSVTSVRTVLAQRETGHSAHKLFDNLSATPDIYTKSGNTSFGVQLLQDNDVLIPLGLRTNYAGAMRFTFAGMDSYDAQITFSDVLTGVNVDLTDLATYTYALNYVPVSDNEENRFFILLAPKTPTPIDAIPNGIIGQRYYNLQGIEIARPVEHGVYLLRNLFESGKMSVVKVKF